MSDANQQPSRDREEKRDPKIEPSSSLSEIGHLFLSSIRDRQTNGAARPVRKAPAAPSTKPIVSIDLTPEEFAQVYGSVMPEPQAESDGEPRPNVSAVIATHLNGRQVDRTREYAFHLAATHGRVGLIEVDAAEFRVTLFERHAETGDAIETPVTPPSEPFDSRRMNEALQELSWDVDRWLLLLPNPKLAECKSLLREVQQWTLLATCDHDGMVSCYRTIKGLVADETNKKNLPQMSLALLDVRSLDEADRVTLKLTGVCEQFLHRKLESESVVKSAPQVSAHLVVCCRGGRDTVGTPQFDVVRNFLTRSAEKIVEEAVVETLPTEAPTTSEVEPAPLPAPLNTSMAAPMAIVSDVIDLVGDDANPVAVVGAFIRGSNGLIDTPVKAPMCPAASLAVSRDRKLVLVAVASEGLFDLQSIGAAYRWMCDNRPLISMALPQFSIEPTAPVRLQLLVDQNDMRADVLQPLLQSQHVTVQTYRKLRWGSKTGLLLEAA